MTLIYSFAPIVRSDAEMLILGSMPGEASLAANQYYAHPQNAFWRIMGEVLGFDAKAVYYSEKTEALKQSRIALWDVLQSCKRKGSLDVNIETRSQSVNDFQVFLNTYTQIRTIFFNGGMAENCFKRSVLKTGMLDAMPQMQLCRLPSTSPANATLSYAQKRDQWLQALEWIKT